MKKIIFSLIVLMTTGFSHAEEPDAVSGIDAAVFEARITDLKGEVYVFHKGEDEGFEARVDTPLEPGDRIETRGRSHAELALEADSILELGSNSIFTVDALKEEESIFALSLGSLVAKFRTYVRNSRRGYRVLTPTAVAAVRGTEFGVEVDEEGGTSVGVYDEGEVAVTTTDESVDETILRAQEEAQIPRGALEGHWEKRDGRRFLKRRKLRTLKARHARIEKLRARRAHLRKAWKRMPPHARKEMRMRMAQNHRARLQELSPEKRRHLRQRMRGRVLKHRIDREKHMRMRKNIRTHMEERDPQRRRGHNMRQKGRGGIKQEYRRKNMEKRKNNQHRRQQSRREQKGNKQRR